MTRKLWVATSAGLVVSGVATSFYCLMAYMATSSEGFLYRPVFGSGPLAAALAVSAAQVGGPAPVLPAAGLPFPTFDSLPLIVLLVSALSQFTLRVSTDFIPTALTILFVWAYLRFSYVYGVGSVGDTRDEFEFLVLVHPSPLRIALRPLIKLVSAACLKRSCFSDVTGDGLASLPLAAAPGSAYANFGGVGTGRPIEAGVPGGATAGVGGAGAVADPVAERRRERALRALDKKLAELRTNMVGGKTAAPVVSSVLGVAEGAGAPGVAAGATADASP